METTSVVLQSLNPHISCYICKGYLVDATAVTECLHTFCKSCIVKRLEFEDVNTCPRCECLIHRSNPLHGIKADRTMQDIVYKLVPDLQCREVLREKIFCEMKDIPYPKHHDIVIKNKQLQVVDHAPPLVVGAVTDDRVCIQLETRSGQLRQLPRKYICCSSFTTIAHVKKLIAKKLFCDLEKYCTVDILCNDEVLGKDHTLKFIYVTRWRSKEPPLMLHYQPRMDIVRLNVTQELAADL